MNKVYFHKNDQDALLNKSYTDIQPGDIILMTAVGANRKARKHDVGIMLLQALFGGKYHFRAEYNHRISHAIVCVGTFKDGSPEIAEINGGGYSTSRLTATFFHTYDTLNAFRPMHVFSPNNKEFSKALVTSATSAYLTDNKGDAIWSFRKGALSLFGRARKKNSEGIVKDAKEFNKDTHCASFTVRSMKNAARAAQAQDYFPDLHTNITPASLYSYLKDQVQKGHYTQSTHVDVDPFDGVKETIEKQITRLQNKKHSKTAQTKADSLRAALDSALKNIDSIESYDSFEKAQQLIADTKNALATKRTNFNPFRKATSLVAVERYVQRVDRYTQKLKW